jgi:hypothetical protein
LIKERRFLAKMAAEAKALFWQSHDKDKMVNPRTGANHFTIFTI